MTKRASASRRTYIRCRSLPARYRVALRSVVGSLLFGVATWRLCFACLGAFIAEWRRCLLSSPLNPLYTKPTACSPSLSSRCFLRDRYHSRSRASPVPAHPTNRPPLPPDCTHIRTGHIRCRTGHTLGSVLPATRYALTAKER